MKKFRICIIDDINLPRTQLGWKQIFNELRRYYAFPNKMVKVPILYNSQPQYLTEGGESLPFNSIDNNIFLEFKIITKITGNDDETKNIMYFKDFIAEVERTEANIWLIDINYEVLEEDKDSGHTREFLLKGAIRLMPYLRKKTGIKLFYSASSLTLNDRLSMKDIDPSLVILDIGETNLSINSNLVNSIDQIIEKYQSEILGKQHLNKLNELTSKVENFISENGVFNDKSIDCIIPDENDFWTLRSLFPKQIFQIQYAAEYYEEEKGELIKRNKKYILDKLYTYPRAVKELFSSHGDLTLERQKELLEILSFIEFSKKGTKIACEFLPITSDIFNCAESNWLYKSISKYSWNSRYHINEDIIRTLGKIYGIYIGHIDYIYKIALHNANTSGDQETIFLPPDDSYEQNKIRFAIEFIAKKEIDSSKFIDGIKDKSEFEFNRTFEGNHSEGIEDILKIICFNYFGTCLFQVGSKGIVMNRNDKNKITYSDYKFDQELESGKCKYIFDIPCR